AAALTSASTPVFLEQRQFDGTLVVKPNNPLPMPTAQSGNNLPFTLSGTSTSEGALSLSQNGSYLSLAGYATAPGTLTVPNTASATVNRVVGRVDASGNINTSTHFDAAFNGSANAAGNPRSAVTTDGTVFWASGTGAAGTAGVQYITL